MAVKLTRRRAVSMMGATPLAYGLASPAIAQTRTNVNFAMGAGAFYFTLHYIAEAGGLYKNEGLDLDEVNVSSGPRQVAAIMGGSSDVGPLGLQLVTQARQRDGNIIAICSGYNILPMSLLLSKEAVARTGITGGMSTDEKVHRLRSLRIGRML